MHNPTKAIAFLFWLRLFQDGVSTSISGSLKPKSRKRLVKPFASSPRTPRPPVVRVRRRARDGRRRRVRTSWANALISNNPKSPKGRRKP